MLIDIYFITLNIHLATIVNLDQTGLSGVDRTGLTLFALNSCLAIGNFCCLLITVANSLVPDQTRQNVRPDLDPNCLTL